MDDRASVGDKFDCDGAEALTVHRVSDVSPPPRPYVGGDADLN